MKTRLSFTLLPVLFLVAACLPCRAVLSIRVTDGTTTVTIVDNSASDTRPDVGTMLALIPAGTFYGWDLMIVRATSKPLQGSDTSPRLVTGWSAKRTSLAAGNNLNILFSDDNFNIGQSTNLAAKVTGILGTTTANSALVRSYYAADNALFQTANLMTTRSSPGFGYFTNYCVGPLPAGPSIALTVGVDLVLLSTENATSEAILAPTAAPVTPTTPFHFFEAVRQTNGPIRLSFTNQPGSAFSILASTNVSAPLSNWTVLGPATEVTNGRYEFLDMTPTNQTQRYFKVRSP